MDSAVAIDYAAGLRTLAGKPLQAIIDAIREEMPDAWLLRYQRMCDGPTNVHQVSLEGVEYLFDWTSELDLPHEDRVVVAFGLSKAAAGRRDASRIRGWPGSDERGDRGHFIAHAAGGGLDINLFHQDPRLNRGWSPEGSRYRKMEQYCADNPGTFFFSRPIYTDGTARPAELEFGILRPDGTLWVELFANPASSETPAQSPTSPSPRSRPRRRRR